MIREMKKFESSLFAASLEELRFLIQKAAAVFIDIPIGLQENPSREAPWRFCDYEAQKILSSKSSRVFLIPGRSSVEAPDYQEACRRHEMKTGKRFSKQAWGLFGKVLETDRFLRTSVNLRKKFFESHPEICLHALNKQQVVKASKKDEAGQRERIFILSLFDKSAAPFYSRQAKSAKQEYIRGGDILDAMVLALSAELSQGAGRLGQLPTKPPRDRYGHPMRIVFPKLHNRRQK